MLEQKIMRIEFITGATRLIPKFFELMNPSQQKDAEDKVGKSIQDMNLGGFKLESIHRILDDKMLGYQIAIFTKETISQ